MIQYLRVSLKKLLDQNSLYLAWLIAAVSTAGSLYFSEIAKFTPCNLCWYQRIVMYPLVAVLAVGIIRKDRSTPYFVLPLSLIGSLIALYHELLNIGAISEPITPCGLGVSCTTRYINWFGFVSIPLLSLLAFVTISALMVYLIKRYSTR